MNETAEFVQFAINQWREKRDAAFREHNLNVEEVYAKGEFESLPPECLMAVCYVDAYACVQAKIRSDTV
ncbi:hypothetical protein NYE33_20450 [Paenibacillus sp. FSL R10-2199]|uniref:hypothetical protein n=1 Tax=Paenibacillus sp. FSL R10-2199 TaxID=2975348 RepID=UPI0030FB236D